MSGAEQEADGAFGVVPSLAVVSAFLSRLWCKCCKVVGVVLVGGARVSGVVVDVGDLVNFGESVRVLFHHSSEHERSTFEDVDARVQVRAKRGGGKGEVHGFALVGGSNGVGDCSSEFL